MHKFYLLFLILIAFNMLSCSEEVKPTPNNYHKLLTGEVKKTWRMVAFEIIEKENKQNKYRLNTENSCEDSIDYYDNYYTFYANAERKFEITEGPEKCSNYPHDDYHLTYYWMLENSTATITFVFLPLFGEYMIPYTIKELTERKMVIEFQYPDINDRYIYQFILNPVSE